MMSERTRLLDSSRRSRDNRARDIYEEEEGEDDDVLDVDMNTDEAIAREREQQKDVLLRLLAKHGHVDDDEREDDKTDCEDGDGGNIDQDHHTNQSHQSRAHQPQRSDKPGAADEPALSTRLVIDGDDDLLCNLVM